MIKIKGKYAEAIIYSNELVSGSEGLIKALCNSVIAEKVTSGLCLTFIRAKAVRSV